jgi:Protein of unknown function (DUF3011)
MKQLYLLAAFATLAVTAVPASADVMTITCGAKNNNENVCELPKRVNQVVMSRQLSGKDCDRGRNWDVRKKSGHDELWIRNGCKAEFTVRHGE